MKSFKLVLALISAVALGGCDIFALDNYDEPTSVLTGRVVFDGAPVGLRSRGIELELWQLGEEWELNEKIPVHVAQDGTFQSVLFDGDYEINLMSGGPWANDTRRIPVQVRGETVVDLTVDPYFVVRNEQIVNNNGTIQATFNIRQVNSSRQLEFVGLYVSKTDFVDRINQVVRSERTRAQIADLGASQTLSVTLPSDIHVMPGPERRTKVAVRIGIKTVGIGEMLFSPMYEIDI